jgi:hypothetical protein
VGPTGEFLLRAEGLQVAYENGPAVVRDAEGPLRLTMQRDDKMIRIDG